MIVHLDWGMDNSLPMLRLIVDYGEARWESVPLIMRSRSIRGDAGRHDQNGPSNCRTVWH